MLPLSVSLIPLGRVFSSREPRLHSSAFSSGTVDFFPSDLEHGGTPFQVRYAFKETVSWGLLGGGRGGPYRGRGAGPGWAAQHTLWTCVWLEVR